MSEMTDKEFWSQQYHRYAKQHQNCPDAECAKAADKALLERVNRFAPSPVRVYGIDPAFVDRETGFQPNPWAKPKDGEHLHATATEAKSAWDNLVASITYYQNRLLNQLPHIQTAESPRHWTESGPEFLRKRQMDDLPSCPHEVTAEWLWNESRKVGLNPSPWPWKERQVFPVPAPGYAALAGTLNGLFGTKGWQAREKVWVDKIAQLLDDKKMLAERNAKLVKEVCDQRAKQEALVKHNKDLQERHDKLGGKLVELAVQLDAATKGDLCTICALLVKRGPDWRTSPFGVVHQACWDRFKLANELPPGTSMKLPD